MPRVTSASPVSKPQPHRQPVLGLGTRQPWFALRSSISSATTPSNRSDGTVATSNHRPPAGGPLLPLLMLLFFYLLNSGSSPSSASCPASSLPSLSTPRTWSPATSSVPTHQAPPLLSCLFSAPVSLEILNCSPFVVVSKVSCRHVRSLKRSTLPSVR
jgi:hypothetical protein